MYKPPRWVSMEWNVRNSLYLCFSCYDPQLFSAPGMSKAKRVLSKTNEQTNKKETLEYVTG